MSIIELLNQAFAKGFTIVREPGVAKVYGTNKVALEDFLAIVKKEGFEAYGLRSNGSKFYFTMYFGATYTQPAPTQPVA